MNQSTRIMFLIGLICNILEIVALIVGIFVCAISVGASDQIYQEIADKGIFDSPDDLSAFFTTGVTACIFGLIFSIAVLVVSMLAKRAQEQGKAGKGYPITIIVLGALDNVFYLVAGILSLIENNQSNNKQNAPAVQAVESKPVEKAEKVQEKTEAETKAETSQPVKKPAAKKTEPKKAAETKPAAKKAEPKKAAAKAPAQKTTAAKKTASTTTAKKTTTKKTSAK